MPAERKTVSVARIRESANNYLASDRPYVTEEMREGCAGLLEHILTQANAYKGFHYIGGYQGMESYRRFYY